MLTNQHKTQVIQQNYKSTHENISEQWTTPKYNWMVYLHKRYFIVVKPHYQKKNIISLMDDLFHCSILIPDKVCLHYWYSTKIGTCVLLQLPPVSRSVSRFWSILVLPSKRFIFSWFATSWLEPRLQSIQERK